MLNKLWILEIGEVTFNLDLFLSYECLITCASHSNKVEVKIVWKFHDIVWVLCCLWQAKIQIQKFVPTNTPQKPSLRSKDAV